MDRREENLSHDEQRIAELIGTLSHVDAPGDFDTRVRARIADQGPRAPHYSWLPVLAGVTAVAVLAFAGYFGLRSFNSGGVTQRQEVANTKTAGPTPAVTDQKPVVQPPAPTATQENAPAVATTKQSTANNNTTPIPLRGGSIDEASKDVRRPFTKDYVPSQHRPNDNSGLGTAEIPVTMILEGIGAHVTWTNGGWRVDSLIPSSVLGRAGVNTGDVIESLDGQTLGEKTSYTGAFSCKSIRVRRGGGLMDILLR